MKDKILTLKEVADYLKLAADGKLPGFKVGGNRRFKASDIERWIEEKKKQATE